MNAIDKYAAIFGRAPYLTDTYNHGISVSFFPATDAGFFKRLMAEGVDQYIYLTSGLSHHELPVPNDLPYKPTARIELMAQTEGQIVGGESGQEDVVADLLGTIAEYIVEEKIWIEPGHTLDFLDPIAMNSAMSAFLFAVPVDLDIKRIRKASRKCQEIFSVIPISQAELDYVRNHGADALIEQFIECAVPPLFDPFRASVI